LELAAVQQQQPFMPEIAHAVSDGPVMADTGKSAASQIAFLASPFN
jgi:hypothetical protein